MSRCDFSLSRDIVLQIISDADTDVQKIFEKSELWRYWGKSKEDQSNIRDALRGKKRDYVEKIPKRRRGSDLDRFPNPLAFQVKQGPCLV